MVTWNEVGMHNNQLKQKYPTTIHNQDINFLNRPMGREKPQDQVQYKSSTIEYRVYNNLL